MSSGITDRLRKMWAVLLLLLEIFLIGQFLRSFQLVAIASDASQAAQRQASHNEIKDQLDVLQRWQETQDKDQVATQAQLKALQDRVLNIEKKEDEEQLSHLEEVKTITEMKTIIEQNQFMARGTIIGVAVLVGGKLIEYLGLGLVTGTLGDKLRKALSRKKNHQQ